MSDLSIVEVTPTQADYDAAKPFFNEGGPAYPQLVQAFARHRASEAERVREACAKVAEEMPSTLSLPEKVIPAHVEPNHGGGYYVPEVRMQMSRPIRGKDIAAAIRSLPIGEV